MAAQYPATEETLTYATALIIEPDESLRHLMARVLAPVGFDVIAPATGAAALEGLASPAAVVVYDPDMLFQGQDLEPEVHRLSQSGLPTIVVTGDQPLTRRTLAVEPVAYLGKPFDIDELVNAVGAASLTFSPRPGPDGAGWIEPVRI
ncbi:MAG TPA: hypothetical protein VK009_09995 [Chloroflexota bacterium]|nr:hypothetical protein [Chloroflexota bacterium]